MRGSCEPATRVRIDQPPSRGERGINQTGDLSIMRLSRPCAPSSQFVGLTKGSILATKESVEVSPDLQPCLIDDRDGILWVVGSVEVLPGHCQGFAQFPGHWGRSLVTLA